MPIIANIVLFWCSPQCILCDCPVSSYCGCSLRPKEVPFHSREESRSDASSWHWNSMLTVHTFCPTTFTGAAVYTMRLQKPVCSSNKKIILSWCRVTLQMCQTKCPRMIRRAKWIRWRRTWRLRPAQTWVRTTAALRTTAPKPRKVRLLTVRKKGHSHGTVSYSLIRWCPDHKNILSFIQRRI